MKAVDLINTDRQSLIVRLEGVDCRLHVWWQPDDASWYSDLEVPVGNAVVLGRRLALNAGLLNGRVSLLAGDLEVRSLDARENDPGPSPWGTTHVLVHVE